MKILPIINGFWNLLMQKLGFAKRNELFEKRLSICLQCKFIKNNFCSLCGCYVKAKTKVKYKLDKNGKSIDGCPRKYW